MAVCRRQRRDQRDRLGQGYARLTVRPGVFPQNGIAWRSTIAANWISGPGHGPARGAQPDGRDGWLYFLHGWTQVIAEVLHIDMSEPVFNRLAEIAAELRPPLVYKPRT